MVWSPAGKANICEISELRPPSGFVEHRKFDVFRESAEARQEAFANARLIASAPEFYAFVDKIRLTIAPCLTPRGDDYLNEGGHEAIEALVEEAEALLAKARG